MNLFRTQPVSAIAKVEAGEITLKRALSARHLVMLGIGAVIGAGIFVMTGNAAANHAGPDGPDISRACSNRSIPPSARRCRCRRN
jgi:amino acid permease